MGAIMKCENSVYLRFVFLLFDKFRLVTHLGPTDLLKLRMFNNPR